MSSEPIDNQQQALVDAAIRRCWGLFAREAELVAGHLDWVLTDPDRVRPRFMGIVRELEQLGIERMSPVALAFLGARMDGLSADAAASVINRSPFDTPVAR